jgi:hypothetical protein
LAQYGDSAEIVTQAQNFTRGASHRRMDGLPMNAKTRSVFPISRFVPGLILAVLPLWGFGLLRSHAVHAQASGVGHSVKIPPLDPSALRVAEQIGVAPLLQRLGAEDGSPAERPVETLLLRQEISELVLGASLDIDAANAVIDYEIERLRGIRADLQARRDHAQNIINIASFLTGGTLGVASSALQFNSSTANIGNGIGVAGGAASVALSVVGLHKQAGGTRTLADSPRMLAAFFGRAPAGPEPIPSEYPAVVWAYLNAAESGQSPATRKELLVEKWKREGHIEKDVAAGHAAPKTEFAVSNVSQQRKLTIDKLSNRESMLLDVRATVSLMKRDLGAIVGSVAAAR